MDKIKAFRNAREFQEIFGIMEHGNGVKSRRNKILLQLYKAKSMWDYCKKYDKFDRYFTITTMEALRSRIIYDIRNEMAAGSAMDGNLYLVNLMGESYWSSAYSTDESHGIPSNGNVGFVKYITHEKNRNNKVYRMRAGKFYKRLLLETELGRALPEQVLNWLCEQFAEQWSSYVMQRLPHFTLNVDDRFDRIYRYGMNADGTKCCTYDFSSCMMGDDQWIFYRDSVDAKAAYLTNDEGYIIARCVIFNNVKDEEGNTWRLAERQYAEEGKDLYKRCLVDALVEGGYIDGYKQVGVDCHATNSYIDKDGNSLRDKQFHIECKLEFSRDCDDAWDVKMNRILSYQDSFKFFDTKEKVSYNTKPSDTTNIRCLDTTDSYLEGVWDGYHSTWCNNAYWVWYEGNEIRCDSSRLEDFIHFQNEYFHKDEFVECPQCGRKMPNPKLYAKLHLTPEFDGKYFCSHDCYRSYRSWYEDTYCFYDQLRDQWVKRDDDSAVRLLHLAWDEVGTITCSKSQLEKYIENKMVTIIPEESLGLGSCIPMYSGGLSKPLKRFADYMERFEKKIRATASGIIEQNKKDHADEIYNNAEVSETA